MSGNPTDDTELTDVLDETGQKTGEVKTMREVHAQGLWHKSAHVWIINSAGELLLQKRSATKRVWPNAWDISAAGHLEAGQTSAEAALREVEEETGLKLVAGDLKFLFTQKHSAQRGDYYDNKEYDDIFLVEREVDLKALKFPPDEVAEFQLMPWKKLREKIEAKTEGFVPHGQYPKLFEIIEKKGY